MARKRSEINAIGRENLGAMWIDKDDLKFYLDTAHKTGISPRKVAKRIRDLYDSGDETARKLFGK